MTLVNTIKKQDERTSQERAAIEAYLPRANELVRPAPIVPKGQHLDVDGILARSLLNPGAFSLPEVKSIVSR
jgi:hypothetical protein